ncbi:MAG: hypothetical protein A4E20_04715 [Nitrospira sp. SG-bin2]|uniref:portal protein n=1 Tax=Nitrospira cf. moscoviensis SBR1015 TaxID=96242 RepID=UPI000A09A63A|nr:hypothetical protein [Nitrospira cf. moscoviensis SBR1015]OQW38079.1 MAG: hypothetical protein A4E20_04715 [Nitrospira sp. SG-bin2]
MLTERQLSAILDNEQRAALGFLSGELSKDREKALDYYYGRPFGTEQPGRSQVVLRDTQDTIEWILPALLKIFTSGDDTVAYEPRGPEDEAFAKQATEYCNYVFTQDNPGFMLLYDFFKDALLQKNGVLKVYWDSEAIQETRSVDDMDDETYTLLAADPDIEIIEHTENSEAGPGSSPPLAAGGVAGMAPSATPAPPVVTHDVKYVKRQGKVCIEAVPPEEFLISRRAKSDLSKAPYVAHRTRKTLSDLITSGFDPDQVKTLPSDESSTLNEEAETRRKTDDEGGPDTANREGVMREVWVTEHYILVDYDEDGIAERRKVTTAGTNTIILRKKDGEDDKGRAQYKPDIVEWEGPLPFASVTPIPVPHRFYGQSIFDQVQDLQLIRSTLLRQMLDNLYLTNNPRHFGDKGRINQDDYNSPEPGGLVGTDGDPNGIVKEFNIPFTAGASLPVMEYLESVRENRTGVTRYNQGIDANSLNKTATGISQIMNAAQQRIELIARVFAETGVKDIFKIILFCSTKYQSKERIIRLRGDWVPMDPRQWESNYDVRVNVGLGTGNKDQMLMHLQSILGIQAQALQIQGGMTGPLVTADNIYNTCSKLVENSGLKHVELYFTDPKNAPPQPPKPDPEMAKVQQQGEIEKAKLQLQAQSDQAKLALEAKKTEQEMQLKLAEAAATIQMKREEHAMNAQLTQQKAATDQQLARDKMEGDQEVKRMAAENKAQVVVGADGRAAKISDTTGQLAEMFASFVQRQAERDAKQDEQFQILAKMLTAETQIVRGADGRATGTRRVMQ